MKQLVIALLTATAISAHGGYHNHGDQPHQANDNYWPLDVIYLADNRRDRYEEMPPEKKKQIQKSRKKFDSLPADEQDRIRKAREKYKKMSPAERETLKEKWKKMSPEERKAYKKKRKQKQ